MYLKPALPCKYMCIVYTRAMSVSGIADHTSLQMISVTLMWILIKVYGDSTLNLDVLWSNEEEFDCLTSSLL